MHAYKYTHIIHKYMHTYILYNINIPTHRHTYTYFLKGLRETAHFQSIL